MQTTSNRQIRYSFLLLPQPRASRVITLITAAETSANAVEARGIEHPSTSSCFSLADIISIEGALREFGTGLYGERASSVMPRTRYSSAVAAVPPVIA